VLGITLAHVRRIVEARFGGLLAVDSTVSIDGRATEMPDTQPNPALAALVHATTA